MPALYGPGGPTGELSWSSTSTNADRLGFGGGCALLLLLPVAEVAPAGASDVLR